MHVQHNYVGHVLITISIVFHGLFFYTWLLVLLIPYLTFVVIKGKNLFEIINFNTC